MIPYALEGIEPRRRPVVTVALLALQLGVFALFESRSWRPFYGLAGFGAALFAQTDAWHLVVDGALFWLPASALESRWGRPVVVAAYLFGGVLGALALALAGPRELPGIYDGPQLVAAAPAAVAAVVGAFAVASRGARMKVGFLGWLGAGKFRAPAWVVAPIFVVAQVFAAREPGGSLIAVVLAMSAGALFAWVAVATGLDAKLRGGGEAPEVVAQAEASVRAAVLEKGGTPMDPIEVASASIVETRARSLPCPACGEVPMTQEHHRIENYSGRLLREVHTRCRRCGTARIVWLAVKERAD